MDAWGLPDEGWKPPQVPPRKEKRLKQNQKPKPYTETEPSPDAATRPSTQDKLDRELQRPQPYTAVSGSSSRPDVQEKLRRKRLRLLAGAGTNCQGSDGPGPRSAPQTHRPTSPAPTYTSLPPYSPDPCSGPSQPQAQNACEGSQAKTGGLLNRLALTTSRRRSREPEWAMASDASTSMRPLPTVPDASHGAGERREGPKLEDDPGAGKEAPRTRTPRVASPQP